jgi:hypothetical protein
MSFLSHLTRGLVCRLQWLLVLTSVVIFGSESRAAHDRILLSQIRDFLTWSAKFLYLSPGTGWPSYILGHWIPISWPHYSRDDVEVFELAFMRWLDALAI